MSLDLEAVRNRLKTLQTQTTKQDSLWKPAAGKSQIRIVPYKFNPGNPFIELLFHFNLGGKSYLSPATFGRPDPILEFSEKLRATGNKDDYKLSKQLEPKMRTFVPVIVRGEENQGVKFWGFGKTVYQELLGVIADPDYGDITDPTGGRDITVVFQTAEEAGKSYPVTTIRVKPNKSVITESKEVLQKISETQKALTDIYKELTYEQLQTVLENYLNPKDEKKADKKASAKVSVDEDDDVEPEVAVAPAKKPVTTPTAVDDITSEFDKLFKQSS